MLNEGLTYSLVIKHGRLKIKDKSEIELEKRKKFEEKCHQFKAGLDKTLEMVRLLIVCSIKLN
jgi:hypothetical protein